MGGRGIDAGFDSIWAAIVPANPNPKYKTAAANIPNLPANPRPFMPCSSCTISRYIFTRFDECHSAKLLTSADLSAVKIRQLRKTSNLHELAPGPLSHLNWTYGPASIADLS